MGLCWVNHVIIIITDFQLSHLAILAQVGQLRIPNTLEENNGMLLLGQRGPT